MGLFSWFRGRTRIVRVNVPSVDQVMGLTPGELYETQPALRAVVSFLADEVAHLPIRCYVRESENDRKRDTDSDLAALLRRPNNDTTGHELIRNSISDYLIYGWCAWLVIPDMQSKSGWTITHIPTSWFENVATFDGLTPFEYTFVNPKTGKRVTVPASDIIRFYSYGVKGPLDPASAITSLKQTLAEQISSWKYRNSVWRNGGLVSAWLSRPKDAPDWQEGARTRFVASWKAKFSGGGTDTGGTPLLEDGMELKSTQFNAKEAQWMETTKLSREDVAGVYHVAPAMIWHSDGQTYASAKENARQLYSDTLGPVLDMFEERINAFLVPKIMPKEPLEYVEFYLDAKLQGSFEDRASVIQSSTGRPWITVNEARGMNNLPAIEGGDELCIPLNVMTGGLASPNDTDPTIERYNAAIPVTAQIVSVEDVKKAIAELPRGHPEQQTLKSRGRAESKDAMDIAACLRKFFKRQARSVLSAIDSAKDRGTLRKANGDFPDWWNAERWNRELAEDLTPLFEEQAAKQGRKTLREIGLQPSSFNVDAIQNYIVAMAAGKAKAINNVTFRQLQAAIDDEHGDAAQGATPKGVFEKAEESRADKTGLSFATAVAGWAVIEAVHQQAPSSGAMKTWIVTSGNPRPEHAALDGETVPYDEDFSNGAAWPGDQILTPEESCNCQCEVEITIG